MKKIRRGNDFVFAWEIERNGLPEDLSSVLEKHLFLSALGKRVELVEGVDYDITGNVVRIEVTPTIATILGAYKAEFHYILPDLGLIDEDRKCAVDVNAFVIVANTEQADNPSEFSITSDMAIAFKGDKGDKGEKGDSFIYSDFTPEQLALLVGDKGDKGDPFTYDDFTPEQIEELQRPATEAAEVANQAAQAASQATENAITATQNAETATENANEAAINANTAAENVKDGSTPEIGENENWFINDVDTGKPSRGRDGETIINVYNNTPLRVWLSPESELPEEQEDDIIYIGYEDQ